MNNDHRAVAGQGFCDSAADSAACARNECDFVFKFAHHDRPSIAFVACVLGSHTATAISQINPPNRVSGSKKEAGYQTRLSDESSPARAITIPRTTTQAGSKCRKWLVTDTPAATSPNPTAKATPPKRKLRKYSAWTRAAEDETTSGTESIQLRRAVWVDVHSSVAEKGSRNEAGGEKQQVNQSQQEERRACVSQNLVP